MAHKCIVYVQYGTYRSKEVVYCDENDLNNEVIAKALKQAKFDFLPMACTGGKIISREPYMASDE